MEVCMALIYDVIALLALWGLQLRRPVDANEGLSVEQSNLDGKSF